MLLVSFRDTIKTLGNADTITISGVVVDGVSKQPLRNVLIEDNSRHINVITDERGFYTFSLDKNTISKIDTKIANAKQSFHVIISKEGFETMYFPLYINFPVDENTYSNYLIENLGMRRGDKNVLGNGKFGSFNFVKSSISYDDAKKYLDSITVNRNIADSSEQNHQLLITDNISAKKNKELSQVKVEAKFPGGPDAWRKYLKTNLKENVPVDHNAPPGHYTITVSFLVHKDGSLSEIKVINAPKPDYGTAAEAVRVIEHGPKWIPAIQNGRPVTYRQKQAIIFTVEEMSKKK